MSEVRPGKWDSWPKDRGAVSVVRSGRTHSGDPVYDVFEDGENIGSVKRGSSQSWRQTSTGVRYGYRGTPTHWEGETRDGRRTGRSDQRSTAIGRLLEEVRR